MLCVVTSERTFTAKTRSGQEQVSQVSQVKGRSDCPTFANMRRVNDRRCPPTFAEDMQARVSDVAEKLPESGLKQSPCGPLVAGCGWSE